MKSFDTYYQQLEILRKEAESEIYMEVDLLQSGLTENQFNEINNIVGMMIRFMESSLLTKEVHQVLYDSIMRRSRKSYEDVKLCFLIDIYRCYMGLNHPTSFNTPEGIGIMLLLSRMYNIGVIVNYEDLGKVKSTTLSLINLLTYISGCSEEIETDESELFLSTVLGEFDSEIDRKYRRFIYSFCKKIASVDGRIDEIEEDWLREIARLNDDDVNNDISIIGL